MLVRKKIIYEISTEELLKRFRIKGDVKQITYDEKTNTLIIDIEKIKEPRKKQQAPPTS